MSDSPTPTIYKVSFKIAFVLLVIVGIAALNYWYINGPRLEHNTAVAMQQLKGKGALTTAGNNVNLFGYDVSFSTIYLLEAIGVALLVVFLFAGDISSLFNKEEK